MIPCEDILNLKLDGMHLIAGEKGLYRMVCDEAFRVFCRHGRGCSGAEAMLAHNSSL